MFIAPFLQNQSRLLGRSIGKACQDTNLTEAEIEKIFQEKSFFVELGYEGFGRDLLAQRGRSRKRFDVALSGFGGRVHAVIEFKKPSAGSLDQFAGQLLDNYVRPQLAIFGVLTNGVEMIVYARTNGEFPEQDNFKLQEATEAQTLKVLGWLQKQTVHLEVLDSVMERLRYHRQNVLLISDPDSEAARIFFQVFQFRPESAFGRMVLALKDILPKTVESSRFTRGSYDFWLKTYARELSYKNIPATWRDFLGSKAKTEIKQLSFALETAYSIISRLILAKAVNDKQFPGVRFVPRIHESLNELAVRGKLTPEKYKQILVRCFERAAEVLFSSIFIQDIFDWWMETPEEESRALFFSLGEAVLTVTQFDFLELSGDLLGELYQRYFDRDTRKALGEFYSPREVVEFILDECAYKGQRGERLLDPSCGSGTFLAAALRRYLKNATGDPRTILQDLTDGLQIVGFDINPFAVLMAQINYAALILSLYAEAIHEHPDFRVLRIPVFRTDSLRVEEREEESEQVSNGTPLLTFEKGTLGISIYLPIQGEKKRYHRVFIGVPRYQDARDQGLVTNLEEYIAALACIFQSVRDPRRNSLPAMLRARFTDRTDKLLDYLKPTVAALQATVAELKGKYDDGRFLKTIEDFVLAVSLKHDLHYEFVVGNPPYVRIQKIPEHVKENWEERYEWAKHNYDIYVPFLERSVHSSDRGGWLDKGGHLGFILSDRFLNVDYGQTLREELPKSLRVDLLFDFRDTRVFGGALNYPAILIASRSRRPAEGDLEAVRVFASEVGFDDLVVESARLRKQTKSGTIARAESVEVFPYPRARLTGKGWWLMPADERAIVDKLNQTSGNRLVELTASTSGGFAGYQTSADSLLVFDEIQDAGGTLKVLPRHEGDGCSQKPIEIEKGAMRPFLFGKDVARWSIDWKRTWVMFPYDRYAKKKTLDGNIEEGWNLIPCKANIDDFEFLNPDDVEIFEDRFPKAWKYLCKHEGALRKREDERFKETTDEGHAWYGASYPRGLDYYFRPKLVVQLLSRRNSFASDPDGKFVFQAGGKGGGVYGIAPGDRVNDLAVLLAFLNSRVADYLIKQTSSVYGGRFYSYADQFLRDLPFANEIVEAKSKQAERLAEITTSLNDAAIEHNKFQRQAANFPASFERDLTRYELDSVGKLCTARPTSAQLTLDYESIAVEKALYGFEIRFGSQQDFGFEHREHADCLAEALRCRKRRTLPLKEILSWRLPVKPEGCAALLKMLEKTRTQLNVRTQALRSGDDELNDLVYGIYGVTADERKVMEDFLSRFSSFPAGSAQQETEEDESSDED